MTGDFSPHVEEKSSFLAWDFLYSDQSSQAFLYLFIASALFASSANGFLFFLTLKKQLWQPHYVLMNHASVCDVGKTLGTVLAVFSSGSWHFSTLLCFSLTSQMTLALMVVERYLLTCHGTDYLRMVTTRRVHITAGLVWLLSGATSMPGGLLLHRILLAAQQTAAELQGGALTIRENITCSREDVMPVLVPPCVFVTLCTLAMCYCCGRMYHASLRASVAVKRLNRRANRSAAFYLLMFLLQLAPHLIIFTTASLCPPITSLVTAQLMTFPSCISAAFQLLRNPQIKPLVLSALHLEGGCAVCPDVTEPDVTEPDGTEERTLERENTATTPPHPLGSVSAFVCY
ncbi:uncharacterized protein ACO6RY_00136 [Pungitius sinensis]